MIPEFNIKKHDSLPHYFMQVKDANNSPVNLTGATIMVTMVDITPGGAGLKIIDRQSAGIVIDDANAGIFHYVWQDGATNNVGKHSIEFEITLASGGKLTIPVKTAAVVNILQDLDDT